MKQKQKSDCNANIPIKEIKSAKLGQFAKLLSTIEQEMMREKNISKKINFNNEDIFQHCFRCFHWPFKWCTKMTL